MSESALHAVRIGAGPPLVMLHGWGTTGESLLHLGEFLAEHREVHILDLPGFGASPSPPDSFGSLDYANAIVRYMDKQGIEQSDFLGHSFGGKVSIQIAAGNPERVRRLVLAASSGFSEEPGVSKHIRSWIVSEFSSGDSSVHKEIFLNLVNEDLSSAVHRIQAPTLILWGEDDAEMPISIGREMSMKIPDCRLVSLPGKDHNFVSERELAFWAHHIVDFLDNVE